MKIYLIRHTSVNSDSKVCYGWTDVDVSDNFHVEAERIKKYLPEKKISFYCSDLKRCVKLANYLSEMKIPDLNSGLRIMKKDILEEFIHLLPDGFSFTSTITLAMLTNGYSTKYEKIDYLGRVGKSKIRPIRDTLNFVQLIVRTTMYFNPLKVFIPLSMLLVIFAFIVLFVSHYLFGEAFDVSFGVLMMTAVMVSAIGMLADLINKRIR